MNILYVSTTYLGGGAEKVARQLYEGVPRLSPDIHTYFLAGRYQANVPEDIPIIYKTWPQRIVSALRGIANHNFLFWTYRARRQIIKQIKEKAIDIVHFHNIHGNYLGVKDLDAIRKACPKIVFTMHDMWHITALCAYEMECDRWIDGCSGCQGNAAFNEGTAKANKIYKVKLDSLQNKGFVFVSPSQWLVNQANKTWMADERVELINNGIDLHTFKPLDKLEVKTKYGIPRDKIVLMFSAHNTSSPYKGYQYLLDAISRLNYKEKYFLLVIGITEDGEANSHHSNDKFSCDYKCMGYIRDSIILNELYVAADIFILPSVAENYPLVAMEAIASGTPVIGTDAGGISEIVNESTGWIVPKQNSAALANKIEDISKVEIAGKRCREYAENYYSEDRMIQQYIALYQKL